MRTPFRIISSVAAVFLAGGMLLTGCTSSPDASSPTPTPTPTPSASSSGTPTPEPEATIPAPSSSPEAAFTDAQLAQTCIDVTISTFADGVEFDIDGTRIEERKVEPKWLVLVPARTNDFDGEAQCTIGGTPADPIIEMSSGSINPLPENQIENLINGENEGGTE